VLRLVALGKSNKDIASDLDIGEETVKTHVRHVLAKLGAKNRCVLPLYSGAFSGRS
jgi:two-component system, NarL family, response regulator LiaR